MKVYSSYKATNIGNAKKIPEHWHITKLKRVCQFKYGNSLKSEDRIENGVPVYGSNGVTGYHNEAITSSPCIIIGRKGSYGKINYSESPCYPIDTTYFIDINATQHNIRFLYYALQNLNLDSISRDSAVPGLSREEAYNKHFILPPKSEQTQIAVFLDKKTARIDDLIAKKQRMIELLREKRQATINHAVSKGLPAEVRAKAGLDPNVKMKDSGIAWIGEIPEHWELKKLKYLLRPGYDGMKIGPFGSAIKLSSMVDKGYKVYGQENVIKDDFELGTRFLNDSKFEELKQYELLPGDVVVTMMGTTGKSKVIPENMQKGIMDSHLIRMRFSDNTNPNFISLLINDSNYIKNQILKISRGSIMSGLNSSIIKSLLIITPPIEEQNQILDYIDLYNLNIEVSLEKIINEISLLREYRQSLISEAVTGKIDVCEHKKAEV